MNHDQQVDRIIDVLNDVSHEWVDINYDLQANTKYHLYRSDTPKETICGSYIPSIKNGFWNTLTLTKKCVCKRCLHLIIHHPHLYGWKLIPTPTKEYIDMGWKLIPTPTKEYIDMDQRPCKPPKGLITVCKI